jgi:hypothetical protein
MKDKIDVSGSQATKLIKRFFEDKVLKTLKKNAVVNKGRLTSVVRFPTKYLAPFDSKLVIPGDMMGNEENLMFREVIFKLEAYVE